MGVAPIIANPPPTGKIHPFRKSAVILEPVMWFGCPLNTKTNTNTNNILGSFYSNIWICVFTDGINFLKVSLHKRAWLHRETMDFFRVKTVLLKKFWIFFLPIFIILSDIKESTFRFSYFYLFKVQRWLNRFVYITTNHSCCPLNCSSVQ